MRDSPVELMEVALIAGAAYLLYSLFKPDGSLNPANPNNPINTGVTNAYQFATGSQGTLGTDFYNWTHDDPFANPAGVVSSPSFSSANLNNPINDASVWTYQTTTGSRGSIGSDVYNWFHTDPFAI